MRKNKLVCLSVLALSAAGVIALAVNGNMFAAELNAEPCAHEHVEHYEGGNGHVDHYACCNCHVAWADEARTTLISENTTTDREKLDFAADAFDYSVHWGAGRSIPFYDATYGHTYRNYVNDDNLAAGKTWYIESVNSAFELESSTSIGYVGKLTNKTSSALTIEVRTRNWSSRFVASHTLAVGATEDISVPLDKWNAEACGGNYGFSIWCTNVTAINQGEYVELTKPVVDSTIGGIVAKVQSSAEWKSFGAVLDPTFGAVYSRDLSSLSAGMIVIKKSVGTIDASTYAGVEFYVYNDSETDTGNGVIWNGVWGSYRYGSCGVLKAKQWNKLYCSTYVWNGDGSTDSINVLICDLGVVNGSLKFGGFSLVEKAAPYTCFGDEDGETFFVTADCASFTTATKTTDAEKGKCFEFTYGGSNPCFGAQGRTIGISSEYTEVEFYVYNGLGEDFTLYSTTDWTTNNQHGTIAAGTWTKCVIPVANWNLSGNLYMYPSVHTTGTLKVTYFTAK